MKDIIYFNSDDEFTDFCLAPYAVIEQTELGTLYYHGVYSDHYKRYVAEGKRFVIRNENSSVYRRQCVCKRVPVRLEGNPSFHREVLVQLPVQNLDPYV